MRRERGFTLVELLVVFGIMALVIGLVPVAYERMREASQYRDAVRSMSNQLRSARATAVSEGREVAAMASKVWKSRLCLSRCSCVQSWPTARLALRGWCLSGFFRPVVPLAAA